MTIAVDLGRKATKQTKTKQGRGSGGPSSQAKGTKSTSFLTRKERSGLSTLGLQRYWRTWFPPLRPLSQNYTLSVDYMKKVDLT